MQNIALAVLSVHLLVKWNTHVDVSILIFTHNDGNIKSVLDSTYTN